MDMERLVMRHCLQSVRLFFGTRGLNTRDELTLKGGLIGGVGVDGESVLSKGTGESMDSRWQIG